ncbi:hypothetical protein PICMEDRAFT_117881 [Pichia membranifaciens NRRL Y-2026]|uniref:Uncharacterized protein n=1 Tax=Pichia membranifaciens NRRL Y-2026 TaxID=763406 RepID=A0A1E3NNM5_9ASCO|nr:hypothetical protein PICMEDRAFT_117881 [Pichia membranifaciens NRRL Y-2026]ODQ47689.1 hypothetical protein PICMEDRAFT_117881 [Pichia membranifaciens NRRL Y-2026]
MTDNRGRALRLTRSEKLPTLIGWPQHGAAENCRQRLICTGRRAAVRPLNDFAAALLPTELCTIGVYVRQRRSLQLPSKISNGRAGPRTLRNGKLHSPATPYLAWRGRQEGQHRKT